MSQFFGPLDSAGRIPARQQTAVASFLISAHGAMARRLSVALLGSLKAAWQIELNTQFYREMEAISSLMRATAWVPDFALLYQIPAWERTWLPKPVSEIADQRLAAVIDIAALGHAISGAIRPSTLLPVEVSTEDPFAAALRQIEFESGRLIQAQIRFLKSDDLKPIREVVSVTVKGRHRQVRELWRQLLESIGIMRYAENE